ncbi:hypothetical protein [Bosea sp. ANAM02]|uniref:hypothetical protein n=1 Tax=Bosea sp. ANAM02 TaxID=2020412 RepID=UPI00140F2957|nr:hypothetical protein [Bosea sp. ANAM02]BCB21997.1 hypothetical protein OCUBac02_48910 [Bosea sp. ANAM02]
MTDFAQMGTVLGAQAAIAQVVADGEQTIAQKNATIADYKAALLSEQIHAGALDHLVDVLMAELQRLDPANRLLKPTGKHFGDGRPQKQLSAVYADKFDALGKAKGLKRPETLRAQAK